MCIISKNRVEWAVAAFAGYGLGIHAVPMYEQQQPSDWEFIVNDSGAKALLVATGAPSPLPVHMHTPMTHTAQLDGLVLFLVCRGRAVQGRRHCGQGRGAEHCRVL